MGCGASSPAGGLSEAAIAVAGPSVAITVKSVPDGENRGTRYVVRHVQSDCIAHYQIGKWEADADLAVLAQLTDPDEPGKTLSAKDVPSLAEIAYETKITLKRPPMGASKFELKSGDANERGRGGCGYELVSPKLDVGREHAGYHALMWVRRDGKKTSRLVAVKRLDESVKRLGAGDYPDPEDPISRGNFLGVAGEFWSFGKLCRHRTAVFNWCCYYWRRYIFACIYDFFDPWHTLCNIHRSDTSKVECFQCHLCTRFTNRLCTNCPHCGTSLNRCSGILESAAL